MDGALGKKKTYKPVSPQYGIKKPNLSTGDGAAVLLIVAQTFVEE